MIADFKERVDGVCPGLLRFDSLRTLQVNVGNLCNLQCQHCHVEAGPSGNKVMGRDTASKIVDFLRCVPGLAFDITGGCPEMNPSFRFLVEGANGLVSRLMVRTNLAILLERGMEWIPEWYRDNGVVLIASMPCYTRENVEEQRGKGVFEKSIEALRRLNVIGYGDFLELDLAYNPVGASLPPAQKELEMDYRRELDQGYGIRFSNLFTITNVPLGRFKNRLVATDQLNQYVSLLADHFNPGTIESVMCRSLVSVDWQGILYNCDFNQVAGLSIKDASGRALELDDVQDAIWSGREITVGDHCYCCTAGAGSSCTGALS